jgi:hypothetical protein
MRAQKVYNKMLGRLDEYYLGRMSMYKHFNKTHTLHEFIDQFIDHPEKKWMLEQIKDFYANNDYSIDRAAAE